MIRNRTVHCGTCGFTSRTFPTRWDDEQRRHYCYCPECEGDVIEVLFDGRGALLTTIPADAMDQLMKQLPAGWFFPMKKEEKEPFFRKEWLKRKKWLNLRPDGTSEDDQCL